jgi:two-component system, OmpR family, sensor kinase
MAGRLGALVLAVLAMGAAAALVVRLSLPGRLLRFSFQSDPASLVLVAALVIAGVLAGLLAVRAQSARYRAGLNAQVAAQESERRRFIQRLDHELKNPITAIQVQLDNLQAGEAEATPAAAGMADVRAQVTRLATLTRGLRRLADLETRPLEIEQVAVDELLEEVNELLQCPDRIQVEVQRVPWAIPPIQADRELLLMVFRNLVDNALKYSQAPVQVRARHTAGHLIVEVIDTGRGILAEELALVAGELYRGSNTHDVAGSGLGLAIVQRIIERHGGRLELRSRPGQGTIATVQLPYDQAEPQRAGARPVRP